MFLDMIMSIKQKIININGRSKTSRDQCYDVLMTAYGLKNIGILSVKGVDFRCILWGISRDEAVNGLNRVFYE